MGSSAREVREEFARALCQYVSEQLRGQDGAYPKGAVRVLDARNHLFTTLPTQHTDEAEDTYALRDLCHVDEMMQTLPDLNRAMSVARNYFPTDLNI